jgi:hypothetical protein
LKWVGNEERDWVPVADMGKDYKQASAEFNTKYVKPLIVLPFGQTLLTTVVYVSLE